MVKVLLRFCLALVCGVAPVTEAAAQFVSAEATLGFSVGGGGTFTNREGAAFDMLVGLRLRETPVGTLVGGLTGGLYGPITSEDICRLGPRGECFSDFPTFLSAGALLGVERGRASDSSARVLAGPMYFLGSEGGSALGVLGRLDVATPTFLHTAVVASLKGAVLPRYQGNALALAGFGLGLRVQ